MNAGNSDTTSADRRIRFVDALPKDSHQRLMGKYKDELAILNKKGNYSGNSTGFRHDSEGICKIKNARK